MSEIEARERYYWSKIRQALKSGNLGPTLHHLNALYEDEPNLVQILQDRIGKTFTAGCIALGDPAPTEEQDHE